MDGLIRSYLGLLSSYTLLQEEMSSKASEAFIQLSRCRYNNVPLECDRFRAESRAFLSVVIDHSTQDVSQTVDHPSQPTDTAADHKALIASQGQVQDESTVPETRTQPPHAHSADSESPKPIVHGGDAHAVSIKRSENKQLNPMRDIQQLPSQSLRETQLRFQAMVESSARLADIAVQLTAVEAKIGALSSIDKLPLQELKLEDTVNSSEKKDWTLQKTGVSAEKE